MDPIKCPNCSTRLNLPADLIGQEVRCPRCGNQFLAQNESDRRPRWTNGGGPLRSGIVWEEGARVFAPWEPEWLYPGTIRCIDENVAFIRFDDGDRALRDLSDLEPARIEKGVTLYSRRDREERMYYPATVLRVKGEDLEVQYDEDNFEEWTTVSFVRLRRRG